MRKWLAPLIVIVVVFVLSKISNRRTRERFPLLKRIDRTINAVVVLLLAVYLFYFVRWLLTR
jgi:hypothetical protein